MRIFIGIYDAFFSRVVRKDATIADIKADLAIFYKVSPENLMLVKSGDEVEVPGMVAEKDHVYFLYIGSANFPHAGDKYKEAAPGPRLLLQNEGFDFVAISMAKNREEAISSKDFTFHLLGKKKKKEEEEEEEDIGEAKKKMKKKKEEKKEEEEKEKKEEEEAEEEEKLYN